jgi:hypothetical protein
MASPTEVAALVKSLSANERRAFAQQLSAQLPAKELAELLRIEPPEPATRNRVWLVVVATFSIVILVTTCGLLYGVFVDKPAAPLVPPELVLSVFTAAVGFLAGLFAPSPVGNG